MDGYLEPNRYAIVRSSTEQWWYIMKNGQFVRIVDTWDEALTYFQDGKVK